MDNHEKYQLIRLPDDHWRKLGKDLVLPPRVKRLLLRYGIYRLRYGSKGRTYGLMTLKGPPGTGKSDTVRWAGDAVVRMLRTQGNGLVINAQALFDEHLGKSPKLVAEILEDIQLSARRGPTVVIWDDAESLFVSRRQSLDSHDPTDCVRVTTTLLHGLDRLRYEANVLQFATLNIEGVVDEAIVSRCDLVLPFELPTYDERLAILQRLLKGLAGESVLPILTDATEDKSGRELGKIEMLAFLAGTADTPEKLTAEDFLSAVGLTLDSVVGIDEPITPEKVKEEEEPCMNSSNNGYPVVAIPRKSRWSLPLRLFARQPASSSFQA